MHIKKFINCFLLVFLLSVPLFGQNLAVVKKIKPAFKEYFGQPRVSVFLHMNKSAYIKGEHIWFKGYLYNRLKGAPLKETVNLYVGLYDSNGNQLAKHLFICEEGYAEGQIEIDPSWEHGQYYLKATTSWMRNFEEDDSFVQQFAVLGEEITTIEESGQKGYDIQFLPEGGHWVKDVQGVLGIKALDEKGKSIPGLEGIIRNQKGEEVTRFRTNRFGLSKVIMVPSHGERYWAFVNLENNKIKKVPLPKVDTLGLSLSVRRLKNERTMILIGTNAETKKQIGNKPHSILIHRDGLLKSLDVVFEKEKLYVSHILEKSEFHSGMNIITLVNATGDPIAERLYFNESAKDVLKLTESIEKEEKDSLTISISGFGGEKPPSLSVSVLPKETKAYRHNTNIQSSFLLKPYIRGFVENSPYYFDPSNPSRLADLDILLLTQGWSKFSWENIFNKPPQEKYDFRTGVDVFGRINSKVPKNTDLLCYAGKNSNPTIIYVNEESTNFRINNYYFEKGEKLKLTLLNKRGNLTQPNLFLRINTGETTDKVYNLEPFNIVEELANLGGVEKNDLEDFVFPENVINLDEVVVRDKVKATTSRSAFVFDYKLKKVTAETERLYPRLLDLIRSSGFNIWEAPNTGYDRIRITSKRPSAMSLTPPSPILYVDDVRYSDFNILMDFSTKRIERYYINRSGDGEAGGAGGVIRVYTRKEGEVGAASPNTDKPDDKFFTHIVKNGFTPKKSYYTPKYKSMMNESFQHFGTIHWLPTLSINENGVGKFKIWDTGIKEIFLFIEGISEDGRMYSTKKIVQVSTNQ